MTVRDWRYEDILAISKLEKEIFAPRRGAIRRLQPSLKRLIFYTLSVRTAARLLATAE